MKPENRKWLEPFLKGDKFGGQLSQVRHSRKRPTGSSTSLRSRLKTFIYCYKRKVWPSYFLLWTKWHSFLSSFTSIIVYKIRCKGRVDLFSLLNDLRFNFQPKSPSGISPETVKPVVCDAIREFVETCSQNFASCYDYKELVKENASSRFCFNFVVYLIAFELILRLQRTGKRTNRLFRIFRYK